MSTSRIVTRKIDTRQLEYIKSENNQVSYSVTVIVQTHTNEYLKLE